MSKNKQKVEECLRNKDIKLFGVVSSVDKKKDFKDPTTFKIINETDKKQYKISTDSFCPVQEKDHFYGLCRENTGIFYTVNSPFIQPQTNKESIVACIMKATKKGFKPAVMVYNRIVSHIGDENGVNDFLSNMSQKWSDEKNEEILHTIEKIEHEEFKDLIVWWHKQRNLRRLYLLGLNNKEINQARKSCSTIYDKCMSNPYTLPSISLEKCDDILRKCNKKSDKTQRYLGEIQRKVWSSTFNQGWTCIPKVFLKKDFPDLDDHINALVEDYEIIEDMNSVYLQFPNKAEVFISDFICELRNMSKVNFEDIKSAIFENDNIYLQNNVYSPLFSGNIQLSEDQKIAITGALNNNISIITGAGGTGKCLHPDIKILLNDLKYEKIKNIKPGTFIRGHNNTVRKVLTVCSGFDNMYKIIPKFGKGFICNSVHILTLKNKEPFISQNNEVIYYYRGIKGKCQFSSSLEAQAFCDKTEKIFDISIDQYIKNIEKMKNNCFYFREKVEFENDEYIDKAFDEGKNYKNSTLFEKILNNSCKTRELFVSGFLENFIIKDFSDHFVVKNISNKDGKIIKPFLSSLGKTFHIENETLIIFKQEVEISFEIEHLGKGEYCGFELDGDGRFLLKDGTVTHNTTVISEIVNNLELMNKKYQLCSFTGKAVSRIKQSVSPVQRDKCSTIHRLIASAKKRLIPDNIAERANIIQNECPDTIIIDEASMVTLELMYDFINAFPSTKHYIFVGDVNQLPPIGWGTLMEQMILSKRVPTYYLVTNHRVYQDMENGIIINSNAIIRAVNKGIALELFATENFTFADGPIEVVEDIVKAYYQSGVRAKDITIVTPYNRCLDDLNEMVQNIYYSNLPSKIDSRGKKWTINDRVILTANDYSINVFNGEEGIVRDVRKKNEFGKPIISVDFGNGVFDFLIEPEAKRAFIKSKPTAISDIYGDKNVETVHEPSDEPDYEMERTVLNLTHSYALTVDKSQGSEWDFVIYYVPFDAKANSFMNYRRTYTAITRAKRAVYIVGNATEVFVESSTKKPPFRCEKLKERLWSKLDEVYIEQVKDQDDNMLDDPPYYEDFMEDDDCPYY